MCPLHQSVLTVPTQHNVSIVPKPARIRWDKCPQQTAQRQQDNTGFLLAATSRHEYRIPPLPPAGVQRPRETACPWASPEHRYALLVSRRLFSYASSSCLIQGRTLGTDSSWPVSKEKRGSPEGIRRHGLFPVIVSVQDQ